MKTDFVSEIKDQKLDMDNHFYICFFLCKPVLLINKRKMTERCMWITSTYNFLGRKFFN